MIMFPVMKGNACAKGRSRVIAIINSKGKIDVISFRDKKDFKGMTTIFLRGLATLIFGLYVFMLSLNRAKSIGKERKEDSDNKKSFKNLDLLSVLGTVGAIIGSLGLILVPYFMLNLLIRNGLNIWLSGFIIAVIRLILFVFTLFSLKVIPAMKQFYRNNSAGNLAIASYYDKKVESYHLSTNFLNYVVWGFAFSFFVVSFIVLDLNFFLRILINMIAILFSFSITYEFLKLLEFKNGFLSRLLIIPMSYLVNERPTQTEREIAFAALNEVILMQNNEERLIGETKDTEIVFSVVYSEVKNRLSEAGITDIAETDWLIAECLGKNRNDIKLLTHVGLEDYRRIKTTLAKREKRMPLSKIFNRVNFYGYDFYVDKKVLSPRPETEEVVEETIKIIKKSEDKLKVLDLMTGSGAIAVTIAKETKSQVVASDVSEQALEIAKKNAKRNGAKVVFIESDMFKNLKKQKFDLIISNPPYIPSQDILTLDDEVKKYDPILALDGGEDGLFFYREIAKYVSDFLNEKGVLVLEIGENQGKEVKKLLQKSFENIKIKKDYNKNERIITAVLKGTYDRTNSIDTKKI